MVNMLDKSHENIVRCYIRAKDENRPYLMEKVFTNSATLEMVLKTENISFPSNAVGLDVITDVLVRKFSQTYENVYTYCLFDSSKINKDELSCGWLVGMNEKEGGNVRVGCGRYNWHFDNEINTLADHLIITIEQMVVLAPEFSGQIMDWLNKLPYPWCDSVSMLQTMPDLESLNSVREQIEHEKGTDLFLSPATNNIGKNRRTLRIVST